MTPNKDLHLYLAETKEREKDLLKSIELYDNIFNKQTLKLYNLKFYCYQSAYKWNNLEFGLVIADECHDSFTPSYSAFYRNNSYKAIIGLSAKVDIKTEYENRYGDIITKGDLLNKYCPIVYRYTIDDAREDDLNRNLDIHIIYNQLEEIEKTVKAGSKKKPFYQTEKEAYSYWSKRLMQSQFVGDNDKQKLFAAMAINKRANLLYNLESKIKIIKLLLPYLKNTIIFGNSLDALSKVTKNVISSRNSSDVNDKIRKDFEDGKLNEIASFKVLKQGANIKGLDNVIAMSYYSSEKDLIQRAGRIRKDDKNNGGLFILVTKDTQEEKWYQRMISNINAYNVIEHKDVYDCIKYIKNGK